ncbi:hypothetical protein CJ179_48380 [Rhodococcus sp. ACS1]|uniref:Membrane protein n=1 Tax=Rhodococcus opacus TaxID=37919 RepID=A0A076EZU8_RHOOP|nr:MULTISPECIES: hypothetical protein [Rhodococcus]AII11306.1 membrane protein [Rhodococcus opacus]MDI9938953.1 hypothetical protein [Rhodococcus sp. IEGM 1351]MDJ0418917.1 hypothetical protein [Rhodococcus opacus]PBC35415.1 hypothetical protein CJ179_48380 [Rhodococcus sp. ACS1]
MTDDDRREPYIGDNSGHDEHGERHGAGGHSRHRWMMVACCVPMLLIAGALVLTGTVGIGGIVFALACVGMMAVMMFSMGGEHRP